ncbi:MAG: alkaline phosphatase family protein [Proteobacteria bacterium]|nr:alkaline phosphatase family protein [Pseudomonadota bacterium]
MSTEKNNKVLIIGLDGGTFNLLQPWMDEGKLPNLKMIQEQGVSGELESTIPPITTPAWSSFMTGTNPGKHGVFYFMGRDKTTGREVPVNSRMRSGATIWRLLSENGKKVLVLNCPCTYPPEEVNGVMISCFLTPGGKRDFIYPKELVDEIESKFGEYPLYLKTMIFSANLSEKNVRRFLDELKSELRYKFEVAHYLLDRVPADLLMIHVWGTDRIQHELWNIFDESHPQYNRRLGEKFKDEVINYFSLVDQEIGRLWERFGKEHPVVVISDHGFGPVQKCIDLNCFLLKEGFIRIKDNPISQLKYLLWRKGFTYAFLFKALFRGILKLGISPPTKPPMEGINDIRSGKKDLLLASNDVDWTRTRAYSKFGIGSIQINLKGREKDGAVSPGEEYEQVRRAIVESLKRLKDPETGKEIEGEIFLKEEIYHGEHMDDAPDIVYLAKGTYLAGAFLGFTSNQPVAVTNVWLGNHRKNGIFLARGDGFEKGKRIEGAKIIDIAPTVLYLMGEKIPLSMDGKVLDKAFTPEVLKSNPKEFYQPSSESEPKDIPLSREDEDDLVKKLKGLGYL